ncbi:hypothetical protein JVT61DRAFT_14403 [Boletus reticuloceps]|uniref:Uncharacterized protein n=1 Tax=Boletus reticuloceps TaxID=495285 RepID=A0A8I3ACL7_9AGAM|nr:hypothetical protein JVT61DRAFT_14403 [Boletus reticuloceps]
MATLPEACPSSLLVVFLDKNTSKTELFKAAREALSLSKSVLVKNFVDSSPFEFTLENLEEHLMISPWRLVKAQDMAMRANGSSHSHVHMNVEQFVHAITNTNIMIMALGLPLPQYAAPSPFEQVFLCLYHISMLTPL